MGDGGRTAPHGRCPLPKVWGEMLTPERGCFLGGTVCLPMMVQNELREVAVPNRILAPSPADGPGLCDFPSTDSKKNPVNGGSAIFRMETCGGHGRGQMESSVTRCVRRQLITGSQDCSARADTLITSGHGRKSGSSPPGPAWAGRQSKTLV